MCKMLVIRLFRFPNNNMVNNNLWKTTCQTPKREVEKENNRQQSIIKDVLESVLHLTPNYFFRLNKSLHLFETQPVKVAKSGLICYMTEQVRCIGLFVHACLQRLTAMQISLWRQTRTRPMSLTSTVMEQMGARFRNLQKSQWTIRKVKGGFSACWTFLHFHCLCRIFFGGQVSYNCFWWGEREQGDILMLWPSPQSDCLEQTIFSQ